MKKLKPSNLFFALFLVLMLIPTTRSFIQVGLQKVLSKVIPASTIKLSEQKKLSNYNLQFKGVNTPDLNFNDSKNKVIFINFWATWCPPCIAEMPAFQALYKKYGQKITFLFVTNDDTKKITNFLTKNNLNLTVYQHISQLPDELEYNSLPTTFVIDKNGKIILHKTGVANWNSDSFYETLDKLILK